MKNTICIFLFLLVTASASGQGWERYFGTPDGSEIAFGIVQTPDGGYLLTMTGSLNGQGFLKKISPVGTEEWSQPLNLANSPLILPGATGNYFISGTSNANGELVLIEVDLLGNVIWEKPAAAGPDPQAWAALPDGFVNFFMDGPDDVELWKIDLNGNLLWEKTEVIQGFIPGGSIIATADGGFALGGHGNFDALVAKFDANGNLEFIANDGSDAAEAGNGSICQTADGGYVVVNDLSGPDGLPSICKFSASGDLEWNTFYDPPAGTETYYVNDVAVDNDGNIILAGRYSTLMEGAFLLKYSGEGDFQFYKAYNGHYFNHLLVTQQGFYCAAGRSFFSQNNGDAYVILADLQGNTFPNAIQGQVAFDENKDCLISGNEQTLEGWTVRALGDFTYYDVTDADGRYFLSLDTGEYTLEIFPPNDLWAPCENPLDVSLTNVGDSLMADFPVQAAIECPAMQVDIGTPFLRRCFENTLTVQFCNLGTLPAEDATVEVTLDSLLEFVGSEIAPSGQAGNTFTFPLGNLGVNECGSFKIIVLVSCDSELGQTLCMEAHAFPDTICGVPFNWSGASMEARAKCQGDTTVMLELENIGTVPTSQPIDYIVIEDQIIFLEGSQVFNPAEVFTFTNPANGATWRVISEQEPNHPGFSFPTAFVEGCGTDSLGMFSTGFVNEHPLADGDGFIDIDCEEVAGAFDPNDKMGFPLGYGGEHFIEPKTGIEYRIRFQNTGTDTAFNVVIRDTLSPLLDPASIRPGSSSHPYVFSLEGNGVAVFTFPGILLPDSTVNEPLSHGYVSFKISQQPDLQPGDVILNSAAIYFDFNEPIITNETFHTIEQDFILAVFDEPEVAEMAVQVYPNPFSEQAVFEVKNAGSQRLVLKLFDAAGRLTRVEKFTGGQLVFRRNGLRDGLWFFQIEEAGRLAASGKLVISRR